MRSAVRVSLVQLACTPLDPSANAERMAGYVAREAGQHGADLVVFPELATTGYVRSPRDTEFVDALYAASETVPGPSTERIGAAAAASGAHVVFGISQRHPRIAETLYNSAVFVGPDGSLIGVQHKVHACRDEKEYYCPGDAIQVFDTSLGTVGLSLCYDVRFPELARVQTLAGADILVSLWASAVQPGKVPDDSIIARCSTRAMENAVFFLGCNRTGSDGDQTFYGRSAIAAPSGDTLAASNSDREEVVRATLDAGDLRAQRHYLTIFRDRRPELYAPIVEPLSTAATPHGTASRPAELSIPEVST